MQGMKQLSDVSFFRRGSVSLARDLLGKALVHAGTAGIITEVEAYESFVDQAAHGYRGKTKRNEALFLGGGCVYIIHYSQPNLFRHRG